MKPSMEEAVLAPTPLSDEALRLLAAEDARQDKIQDLLETIREQIRLEIAPEHRPEGLMTNIQNAVYAMRGRTRLMNDVAITTPLSLRSERAGWQPIDTAPKDGTRILLAKIVGHPDHDNGLWWATVGHWSSKWNNWNDGIEPAGLVPPTHWMHVTARGVGRALPSSPRGGRTDMTPKQCAIAADIIEAGRFTLNDQSDDDAVEAAAFVFDQGVLYLPTEGKREIVAMLRERATQEPS